MNQFVDALIMLVTNPHKVGFLVAEKSYNKPIIGHFAKAVGSIPVTRPQDAAEKGPGQISFDGCTVRGVGTSFTSLKIGDKIRPGRNADGHSIKSIVSDIELIVADTANVEPCGIPTTYDILRSVDQSQMFDRVHAALAQEECLAIFPEGGSHDHTHLLPLKAGIAAIAFGVMEKYAVNVPIVPVGLNYYRGHRFRGRVVIEFGAPLRIDNEMYQAYRKSKREGYQQLLSRVEDSMKGVLVTARDYNELKLLHTARRLYQNPTKVISTQEKQNLARRFSVGFSIIRDKHGEGSEKTLPNDIEKVRKRLAEYQASLDEWGLRDYQINALGTPFASQLQTFFHALLVWILAVIPSLVLNAPVGFAAHYWAHREAKKDLKNSRVKLHARDVLLSKKILFSLVAVPVLWLSYSILLYTLTPFSLETVVLFSLGLPVFSYIGVMAVEAGMVDLKDLRPAFLRLLPSFRTNVIEILPKTRLALQMEVKDLVRKYGPELGDLYYKEEVQWHQVLKKVGSRSDLDDEKLNKRLLSDSKPLSSDSLAEQQEAAFGCGIVDVNTDGGTDLSKKLK
eukprot:CAMPEP_0185032692 /NCGR_PEP_ID=MMETSP1103-20130426/20972_1 /TAXON_ID=36769 /ORGANISM="Paraphysomonas bandaiensis, Strain Caron Lab Isolate" /LENGTH=564 /DNA_ID=CAMNT_0027568675 /DNA_START=349 /DNA_END=2043 /DNA_ORIENTATION=-